MSNIITHSENGIFTITVNRPDKLNALNYQTIQDIGNAIKVAESASQVRGIILTGSGEKAFVAGRYSDCCLQHSHHFIARYEYFICGCKPE